MGDPADILVLDDPRDPAGFATPAGPAPASVAPVSAPIAGGTIGADVVDEDDDGDTSWKERTTRNGNGTHTYRLLHPVTITYRSRSGATRTETIAELTFRRVSGGDMRALDNVEGGQQAVGAFLFQRLAGILPQVYDRLDGEDIAAASNIVAGFFGASRGTGPKSSRR
jgi:hypothetical protein